MTAEIRLILTWAALMVLLAAAWLGAQLGLGPAAIWASMGISAAKTALIGGVFMNLRRGAPLVRLAAGGMFLWLAILLMLTQADYLTR